MFAGAMLDLGVSPEKLLAALDSLSVGGYKIEITKKLKNGISATDFDVVLTEEDHHHDGHHHHRSFSDIKKLIEASGLETPVKFLAIKIFTILAQAEGKIHGVEPEAVTFHEVGAVDSIIDIVAAAFCVNELSPGKIVCSVLTEGSGEIKCAHGLLPVPVPATAEILREYAVPFRVSDVRTELVTPTGAAIAAAVSGEFGVMPEMTAQKIGYGCGKREIPGKANILRAFLGEAEEGEKRLRDRAAVIETNIDDDSGETLGYAMEKLLEAGALDVFYTPIVMKKNRPAYMLTVLCGESETGRFSDLIFSLTSSAGARVRVTDRIIMQRKILKVATRYGEMEYKTYRNGATEKIKVEFESARRAAEKFDIPISEVYKEVLRNIENIRENNDKSI